MRRQRAASRRRERRPTGRPRAASRRRARPRQGRPAAPRPLAAHRRPATARRVSRRGGRRRPRRGPRPSGRFPRVGGGRRPRRPPPARGRGVRDGPGRAGRRRRGRARRRAAGRASGFAEGGLGAGAGGALGLEVGAQRGDLGARQRRVAASAREVGSRVRARLTRGVDRLAGLSKLRARGGERVRERRGRAARHGVRRALRVQLAGERGERGRVRLSGGANHPQLRPHARERSQHRVAPRAPDRPLDLAGGVRRCRPRVLRRRALGGRRQDRRRRRALAGRGERPDRWPGRAAWPARRARNSISSPLGMAGVGTAARVPSSHWRKAVVHVTPAGTR